MSISVIQRVLRMELPTSRKLVLIALASFLREQNPKAGCWPSVRTLMAFASTSDRTVHHCLDDLESDGHISREKRKGRNTRYFVHPVDPRNGSRGQVPFPSPDISAPTSETVSLPPGSSFASTSEGFSRDQESVRIEKGTGGGVSDLVRRSRKALSVREHLEQGELGRLLPSKKKAR